MDCFLRFTDSNNVNDPCKRIIYSNNCTTALYKLSTRARAQAAAILFVNQELEMTNCQLSLRSWHSISSLPVPLATHNVLVHAVLRPPNKSSLSQEEWSAGFKAYENRNLKT